MIHGMWCGPWIWDNYRRVFEAEGYHCVTTTLPYHAMDPRGVPDPRLGTASLLDYAEALEQEVKQLGAKPILMGHSMGGLLAQILGTRMAFRHRGPHTLRYKKPLDLADNVGLLEKTGAPNIWRGGLFNDASAAGGGTGKNL